MKPHRVVGLTILAASIAAGAAAQAGLSGRVQAAGKAVSGSTVTAYAAGSGAPAKLGEAKTDAQGTGCGGAGAAAEVPGGHPSLSA